MSENLLNWAKNQNNEYRKWNDKRMRLEYYDNHRMVAWLSHVFIINGDIRSIKGFEKSLTERYENE